MKTTTYRWILYGIALVIGVTISIQIFWNYKNYKVNKQKLYNEVQLSLDKAVDDYYAIKAENSTLGLFFNSENSNEAWEDGGLVDKIAKTIDSQGNTRFSIDTINADKIKGIQIFKGASADSLLMEMKSNSVSPDSFKVKVKDLKQQHSLKEQNNFNMLTSKIVFSISNDTLDIKQVDSLFVNELSRKSIDVDYELLFFSKKDRYTYLGKNKQWPEVDIPKKRSESLVTESKSTFLPDQSTLLISFSNTTKTVLSRGLSGILISLVLIIAVMATLFYLLKIIQNQKQTAEIKNDLISNITHEFKTPIATIGVALEGIQNFDVLDDKEKTKTYLNMSTQQLDKLNLMVEKLLETASLDTNSLELDQEPEDAIHLLETICNRFSSQSHSKTIKFSTNVPSFIIAIDVFHFENAINNIIDNAIKYGGESIEVTTKATGSQLTINLSDNGTGIPQEHQKRIFDKFYRIPKGNTHDVKGFGIGLYYTKTIIERHGGILNLNSKPGRTTFSITLTHGNN